MSVHSGAQGKKPTSNPLEEALHTPTSSNSHATQAPSEPALEAEFTVAVGNAKDQFTVTANLALTKGVLVLFGPSGSGKSLTLQGLAGLIRPLRGRMNVFGQTLFDSDRKVFIPPHKRKIGYVPQHHSLFPFLTVEQNVVFGLSWRQRRNTSGHVAALLEELGIAHLARARPASLSGGERQRVALARALAVGPRLLLLDEPFASIDQDGRSALRRLLRTTLEHHETPAVFVTHDPDEAMALGDTLVRFERGRTVCSGTPTSLLRRGHPVVVSGASQGGPTPVGDGRAVLNLESATIEGPTEILTASTDGSVRLELRTRPR